MCEGKHITPDDLAINVIDELPINLRHVRQDAEKHAIKRALFVTDSNYSAAAKMLGISRPTLYDLMKKYDIVL